MNHNTYPTAIIGAGISGVSVGKMLWEAGHKTVLFERASQPGGLVRCERLAGNLYHRVGGHVFNCKDPEVAEWFWSHFDRDKEFIQARRNAKIWLAGQHIGYPIENYLYQLPAPTVEAILDEVLALSKKAQKSPGDYPHFAAFLEGNFGKTLYERYFKPYNEKIWQTDLSKVSLEWLEGKLPMPNYREMLLSNILRQEEDQMVHSTFYYPCTGGSQFIIDRLAEGLDIRLRTAIELLQKKTDGWYVHGEGPFEKVIFTGDVRRLGQMLRQAIPAANDLLHEAEKLVSNGTSNLLCETDPTDLSWLYLPEPQVRAHRIIYTGNFSQTNNAPGQRPTCTVEFSGKVSRAEMEATLPHLPGNLKALDHNYEPNSYVVQDHQTRPLIQKLKAVLEPEGLYLLGRFAEWEYYNMDKAMEAGRRMVKGF